MSTASVETAAPANGSFIAALHLREFRNCWLSSVLSGNGQWTLVVARGWLMDKLTHSAGAVGLVTFAAMIPYLVATPVGGILADRFDRRRLAAAMQGVSLLASLVLALLVIANVVQPWEVVALALLAGAGRSVETPAVTALIPNLVPSQTLLNAISLNSMANFGSRLLGPAAALGLLAAGSISGVLLMTAGFYAVAIVLMLSVRNPGHAPHARAGVWRETRDTWAYVARTPLLPVVFALMSLHCGLTMLTDALWPEFTRSVLHAQASTFDLLLISFGAGTMIGTFSLGGLRSDIARGSVLATTGVLSGLTMAMLGLVSTPLAAFLVAALIGAAQGMYMTMGTTLVQEVVPDEIRGRVSSAYLMATGGTMSFGILGAGALTDAINIHFVLFVPPLLFVAFVLLVSGVRPGVRGIYRTGSLLQRRPQPALATVES